jgi:glycosyltransferase involved in cell wall biosynthesis
MKITHVIGSLATGGAETLVVNLCLNARKRGHDARIVTLEGTQGVPYHQATKNGLSVSVIGRSRFDPRILRRLHHYTKDADIVHVHLFPALYWSKYLRPPKVYTEHNTHNRRMGRRGFRLLERWAYKSYKTIVAISEGVASRAERHLSDINCSVPVEVILNGIGDNFYGDGDGDGDRQQAPFLQLLFIGSLNERKNPKLALQVMRFLPGMTLDIAGEGPMRAELEREVKSLGLQDRVRLLGEVDEISDLIREKDIFLSTSVFEGFGLVAAEAQASGMPVIGPNVSGLSEVVVHGVTGFLFDTRNPAEIASHVLAASEPTAYSRLSSAAAVNAKRFKISVCSDAHIEMYERLLQSRPLLSERIDGS